MKIDYFGHELVLLESHEVERYYYDFKLILVGLKNGTGKINDMQLLHIKRGLNFSTAITYVGNKLGIVRSKKSAYLNNLNCYTKL